MSVKFLLLPIAMVLVILTGSTCDKEPLDPNPPIGQELVLFNGTIYTVNESHPWATAVYVRDGIIRYVGSDEEAKAQASESAEQVNLRGAFVMPGIHDVHLHPLEASTENFQFILDDEIEDAELYADDVADALAQNPGTGWILGWGHWIDVPLSANRLPKRILDEVAPDRPVAILEQTSHSVWCNSKALELIDQGILIVIFYIKSYEYS